MKAKIENVDFKHRLETDEPMHCWRKGCKEELNGLMHYSIDFGKGFVFDCWLCDDCHKRFEELVSTTFKIY